MCALTGRAKRTQGNILIFCAQVSCGIMVTRPTSLSEVSTSSEFEQCLPPAVPQSPADIANHHKRALTGRAEWLCAQVSCGILVTLPAS